MPHDLPHLPDHLPPELKSHLECSYTAIVARPYDSGRVAGAIECLLEFLASPVGRTDANCTAVDLYFCLQEGWEATWEDEPEILADIMSDLGGALHDTVSSPEIAENFESTPEQLLVRLRRFRVHQAADEV